MIRLNRKNRLLSALTVTLTLAFLGVSTINYLVTRESVHAEIIRNDLPLTMDNIYSELSAMLTRPLLVSSSMASDTFLKDWVLDGEVDTDKIIRYLEQIGDRYDFFTTFFVSAQTLRYYRYNGVHKVISPTDDHDVWFYNFINSDREYDFDVDTDQGADNLLTIFVNYRVLDSLGRLLGVTGVGLKVDNVANRIAEYQQKYATTLMTARSNLIRTLIIGGLVSGVVILLTLLTINRYQERIEALAVSDELTGTANRHPGPLGW